MRCIALAGELTYETLRSRIDETVLVERERYRTAIHYLAFKEKVIAEGQELLSQYGFAILSGQIRSFAGKANEQSHRFRREYRFLCF